MRNQRRRPTPDDVSAGERVALLRIGQALRAVDPHAALPDQPPQRRGRLGGQALPQKFEQRDSSGSVAGRITLSGIVRGPFQSCSTGYWVSVTAAGCGLATAAVRDMVRVAFGELRLHRVQAATLLHNVRSQGVLKRNGFRRIGMAPAYLSIAGQWQDHGLFLCRYQITEATTPDERRRCT
jgi:RimJ/RimL family protein N-acetyltransferase